MKLNGLKISKKFFLEEYVIRGVKKITLVKDNKIVIEKKKSNI